ncbi:spermatogenesis-associated protein 6 isoform X3 [Carcharodon carcharias]|uniref:spermatogenesis-associated protein 6 isoform X3 n=1 Tax=Carcharodon carcharias TaxID=13397 RepID=UPI001B7E5CB9|nr:spermatogenesis-associated protein 6 isoform X3 [Carcharodon carcharias]
MPKKVLRLTVYLKIQAVTCPGVFLPEKNDVYVSVYMLGKFQKTKFLPSVFPLTFNDKMKIEKNFPEAMNPGDVADMLEMDTTKFELIQLTPPAGETLAIYEQNTREFLYPGRRLTPSYPGMDRELLMKRSIDFPGIAPRLEFSTTSIIKECPLDLAQIEYEVDHKLLPTNDLYIASSSLSSKPSSQKSWPLGSPIYNDPSLRGSYGPSRTSLNAIKKPHEKDLLDDSFEDTDEPIMSGPAGRQLFPAMTPMKYSTTSSFQKQSPALNRLSLRERFYPESSGPTKWEEIHQRVLKVLKSNSARQRLQFDSSAEVDYPSGRSALSIDSLCDTSGHLSSVHQQNASVHLGDGDYWSNRAAVYKGKPHRAIFEESLEKIYRNMYKKAADST